MTNFRVYEMELYYIYKKIQELSASIKKWSDSTYSKEKCQISAVLSYLSYDYLSEYELENHARIKFYPTSHYKKRIINRGGSLKTGWSDQLNDSFNNENTIIVETDDLVIIIHKLQDALFVTFRGTKGFYDIMTDLKFFKVRVDAHKYELRKLHFGFISSVRYAAPLIFEAINNLSASGNLPIYFTGHSLGGAMATIAFNEFSHHSRFLYNSRLHSFHNEILSCYTFGSPRYGNKYYLLNSRLPYHFFNDGDIIPSIPPTFFGYHDNHNDKCLDGKGHHQHPVSKGNLGLRFRKIKPEILSLKHHSMEIYLERIFN